MRYAFNGNINISEIIDTDVLIVGSGLAGVYAALNVDPKLNCIILTKEGLELSSSWLAQGGIAAAVSKDDTPDNHFEDTLSAGAYLNDKKAVHVLVDEGPQDILKLQSMGVPFDLNAEGALDITREGGHRMRRVVHAGGDATGRESVKALSSIALRLPNIRFFLHCFFVDIITDNKGVCGAIINDTDGKYKFIRTRNIVICTGGIGQVYSSSTNPIVSTGDGIAAAIRAGAVPKNMEFVQFHPTGLYSPTSEQQTFLISEAVRGEGGLLKNSKGERFMVGKHPMAELAPRDIVARGIIREMQKSSEDHVYVDITSEDRDHLAARFPTIFNECLRRGIDMSKDYIPVCPVQHYLIGGIETNLDAMTNVPGLFVCGEAACTGVHGANRLASNSMLECLVFGRRAAQAVNRREKLPPGDPAIISSLPVRTAPSPNAESIRKTLQQTMTQYAHALRTKAGLENALKIITEILETLENTYEDSHAYFENINIATVAKSILTAALARDENVGAHYRED